MHLKLGEKTMGKFPPLLFKEFLVISPALVNSCDLCEILTIAERKALVYAFYFYFRQLLLQYWNHFRLSKMN